MSDLYIPKNRKAITPQEAEHLNTVTKMFVGREYSTATWTKEKYTSDEEREVINMLMSLGFLAWEKRGRVSRIVRTYKENIVFPNTYTCPDCGQIYLRSELPPVEIDGVEYSPVCASKR